MSEGWVRERGRLFLNYMIAVVAVVVAFLLRQAMVGHLGAELPHYITFYPAVMLVAILAGLGPGLLATVVAALLTAYWILPPQGQFAIAKTSDAIALILFSGMGTFISVVAERYRQARRKAAAYDKELALRETQEALRQSEERLRDATTAANIGIWNWNPQTGEVKASANWKGILGVGDDADVTFDTWRDAVHPDDRDRVVNALMATVEQRHLWDSTPEYNVDYRVIWPNGSVRWVVGRGRASYDENGRAISVAGVNLDITERKQAEERIAHLASFPELNPNPIFETDLEGKITYANPVAQRQFPGLVEPGNEHPLLKDWASLLTMCRDGAKETITRAVEADGATFLQTIHYAPEMSFFRAYLVDITDRKRADEALRATLDAKTALLKEVHHRVKNNLQIVSSLLNLQTRQVKNQAALETLRDTQGRIRSMALLHETLYREGNAARVNCAAYFSTSLRAPLPRIRPDGGAGSSENRCCPRGVGT